MKYLLIALTLTLTLSACSDSEVPSTVNTFTVDSVGPTTGVIEWSDGDSGRIGDFRFRLKNVDAGETRPVNSGVGPAQCEQEIVLGMQAEEYIVALTQNAAITVTDNFGPDAFDRNVVNLDADGIDVASAGLEAGVLRPWPHDSNGNALAPKPDWCSGLPN